MTDDPETFLELLGIPPVPLLVHTAFRPISREGMSAEEYIGTLMKHPGPLLFPAFSWKSPGPWDVKETPSCVGYIPELFRVRYASARSNHPTHSVCGVRADDMLSVHDNATPCPVASPFGELVKRDGWILMAGVGMDCCSLIHHAEELYAKEVYLEGGKHRKLKRDYWKVEDELARKGFMRNTFMGSACLFAFPARELMAVCEEMLRADPMALISDSRWRLM